MTEAASTGEFAPGRPVPLEPILSPLRRGSGDPTWHSRHGEVWRATRMPTGPATLRLRQEPSGDRIRAQAWGPGSGDALDGLPGLLGGHDDPSGFAPRHAALAALAPPHRHWRVCRTGRVIEALVPAVIEQRVTGKQAFGAYRRLVRRFGEPAPGPGADLGLMVPPDPAGWARIPSWEWIQAGVDAARSDTVMRVVRSADALEKVTALSREQAWRRLRSIPGIGVWTAAETLQRACGDADAISFGDYHVAADIGWALTGREVDDAGLETLLEPYRGHRYRVQYVVTASRAGRPRRGPRMSVPTHLPVRHRAG